MLELGLIALPSLLDFGSNFFNSKRKKKQAKKKNELLTKHTIQAYEEDKASLLMKDKIRKEGQVNLLNENLASSKAKFAANGIKKSLSADNFLDAQKESTFNDMQNEDKILNLNLQKLYNAMERSITSGKFDYQNTVSDLNFGLASSGINALGSTGIDIAKSKYVNSNNENKGV